MRKFSGIKVALHEHQNSSQAAQLQRFFKTGQGEYGAGDQFLGIKVPVIRQCIKPFGHLGLTELKTLIRSKWHEERLAAVLLLIKKYEGAGNAAQKEKIYRFYVRHFKWINNWDLVDLSAPNLVGAHLFERDRSILKKWAASGHLWTRRIAVLATFYFIRQNEFKETLLLARMLLKDAEDLMHKAAGWMLREAGKRDLSVLEDFLRKYYRKMPRTMLRYAIERLDERRRLAYLHGDV